jgi:hypothetical protein
MLVNINAPAQILVSNNFSTKIKFTHLLRNWDKGQFLCLIEGHWAVMLQNELYCSLVFCSHLNGPLTLFGCTDRHQDEWFNYYIILFSTKSSHKKLYSDKNLPIYIFFFKKLPKVPLWAPFDRRLARSQYTRGFSLY